MRRRLKQRKRKMMPKTLMQIHLRRKRRRKRLPAKAAEDRILTLAQAA
jgi:hypothetical protein